MSKSEYIKFYKTYMLQKYKKLSPSGFLSIHIQSVCHGTIKSNTEIIVPQRDHSVLKLHTMQCNWRKKSYYYKKTNFKIFIEMACSCAKNYLIFRLKILECFTVLIKKRNFPNIFLVTIKSNVQVLINQLPHNAMRSMSGETQSSTVWCCHFCA